MNPCIRAFRRLCPALVLGLVAAAPGAAQSQETYIRVVDVGQGLCVVARAPGGETLLYDAGFSGDFCGETVRELAGSKPIDVVVFSHSDRDHILDGDDVLARQGARRIIHPGDHRSNRELDALRRRIDALEAAGTSVIDLDRDGEDANHDGERDKLPFGTTIALGSATLRFVAGWSDGAQTVASGDPALPDADRRNALSLVFRIEYGGRSVLLTGDTIGRRRGEPGAACRNAERMMAQGSVTIDSDVLVGQHHGGDNGTSNCFIRAVSPTWVVFSAGRGHGHPTQAVANRLIANQIDPDKILRTDRADASEAHWVYHTVANCRDEPGDDDVEIRLFADGRPAQVQYREPEVECPSWNITRPPSERRLRDRR